MTTSDASKLFTAALNKVESASIRAWARRQRPAWVKIVRSGGCYVAGRSVTGAPEVERASLLAAYIVLTAMG